MTKMLDHRMKYTPDGRAILNLGCGTRTHNSCTNVDFSIYALLANNKPITRILIGLHLLSSLRIERLHSVDPHIIRWNLTEGIPFSDQSVDVVYSSHFLEHLNRRQSAKFLEECFRVLKRHGIIRIVVPDLKYIIDGYNNAVEKLESGNEVGKKEHRYYVDSLFDQFVRETPKGLDEQTGMRKWIESTIGRSPEKAGELHKWMYDEYSLGELLLSAGFSNIIKQDYNKSIIHGWEYFELDLNKSGEEYKAGSLYMEGKRLLCK